MTDERLHSDDPDATRHVADDPDGPRPVFEESGDSRRIGPYVLRQKIGEGGMGEVWLAEQLEPIQRQVALKVIKRGMDSKQVVARFEIERQALAMMDHPAIAKIHDAGTTPRGRPYFVMEYVRGVPITEHCDRHRLTNRERLELFVQVCEGVQHAHQKAVIHRDLKPSNVLVTIRDDRPQPKIIDFGVAKATARKLTDQSMFTQLGVMVGTPAYMSPEQAEMTEQDVDTRTDVYSLGVLLYELLVGELPFDMKELGKAGYEAVVRTLRESEPLKPSTRLSAMRETSTEAAKRRRTELPTLKRELSGDLDWITMKALEKDRARRYETANGLAADIRRHLNDEPVVASPPSASYRLRKLVRRNRAAFTAVTAVFVALLLGVAASTWSMLHARRAERSAEIQMLEAQRQSSIAEAVNQFLNRDLLSAVMPSARRGEGRDVTMREVLDVAGERIEEASREGGEFADKPLVEASIRTTLGTTYLRLGEYELAEPHYERAMELTERTLGESDPKLAPVLNNLANLHLSQGRYDEAEPLFRRAIEIEKSALGEAGAALSESTMDLALLSQRRGNYDEAEALYRQVMVHQEAADGPEALTTTFTMYRLANLLQEIGQLAEAESLQSRVFDVWTRTLGERAPWTLASSNSLANVYASDGRLDEAAALMIRTLELKREVYGPENPTTLNTLNGLGELAESAGRYEDAERYHRETLELRTRTLGEEHPRTLYSMTRLAFSIARRGRYAEAEPLAARARDLSRSTLGADHPTTMWADDAYGAVLVGLERWGGAEVVLRDLVGKTETLGEEDPIVPLARARLATVLGRQGRPDEAERLLETAIPGLSLWDAEGRHLLEAVAAMYVEWHATAPEGGYADRAAELRSRLVGATP